MIFRVCEDCEEILFRRNIVRLQREDLNDSGYRTCFEMTYYDAFGREHYCGEVKIGKKGMQPGDIVNDLPKEFTELPEHFFLLGQDEDCYERIKQLGADVRQDLLLALRDMAYQPELLDENMPPDTQSDYGQLSPNVVVDSLLKGIATNTETAINKVKGQLSRMAHGDARLTKYHFQYTAPGNRNPVVLDFMVDPNSKIPTNVHAMIGRNGCGKTYLIRNMVQCLQLPNGEYGQFIYLDDDNGTGKFVNVMCIAFSPFDDFASLIKPKRELPATYVGLNKKDGNLLQTIEDDFLEHFQNCLFSARKQLLWKRAIKTLASDPTFSREGVEFFMDDLNLDVSPELPAEKANSIRAVFRKLSSGHKIVLLIITSCVAEIEEQSVLFLDEPENHLHPPLLSALIRALSDLLKDQNGVAIVSTHSPVVLQELPNSCVKVIERSGIDSKVEQLDVETFGSTVGLLTQKVFGLSSRDSGFYQLLRDAVDKYGSYDRIMEEFEEQLGDQAEILLRTMLMLKKRENK